MTQAATAPARSAPPSTATLTAIALVAGATLAYQVVLTRLFSAVLAYHFSFLAISLALIGTGAGALYVFLRDDTSEPAARALARWSARFAGLLVACPLVLVRLDFETTGAPFAAYLSLACAVAALPPFASGVAIALAISRHTESIGRVYAFDLVGAGLGALVIVPALVFPAPHLLVALGALAALASGLFATHERNARAVALGVGALTVAVAAIGSVTPLLYLPHRLLVDTDTVFERWTPLARVFGYDGHGEGKLHEFTAITYDRVYAPVPIVGDGPVPDWQMLVTGPSSIGYQLTGPGHALVIGGGGGRDIYTALSEGQRPVDVIELNEGIRATVDEDLGHLSGAPYSRDGVFTVIGDGRSQLAARDVLYDQIHIGFTDTLSGNAAQGFALTENNLYTVEAFLEYFAHLKPRGVLNVSRPLRLVGEEALKMTVLAVAALEELGVKEPLRHVVVVLGRDLIGPENGTILARKEPYSEAELARLRTLAQERGNGLALVPGGPNKGAWAQLAEAKDARTFCQQYPLDVCPPTDDRPFFFSMQRLGSLGERSSGALYGADPFTILSLTLVILLLLSGVALVAPLALTQRAKPGVSGLVFFGAIGLGFLLVEIVLVQRFVLFLGFPTYALSIVLCALLIFTGVGSALSARTQDPQRTLMRALTAAIALIAVSAYGLQPLLRALIDWPFAVRVVAAMGVLAPFGVTLGMAMPLGLRRLDALEPEAVPFAWGVNGIASVVASVLGVAVAIRLGFPAASLLACVCYGVALFQAMRAPWPQAS